MKIVHLITRLILGGAQENTILSCEGLARLGHDVFLLSGPTSGPEGSLIDRARAGGYRCEEIPSLLRRVSLSSDRAALADVTARLRQIRPDVVHTHSSKAGVIGRIAAHRCGVPMIIHTIHGMSFNRTQPWLTRRLYAALERYCARKCHHIVSVADAMTRQALAAGIGVPAQYRTIRSGMIVDDFDPARCDPPSVRRSLGIPHDAIVVGTVARLFRNKGYEQLIDVMRIAAPTDPRLHFLWIGDGAHRQIYERQLHRFGLRERVTFAGLVAPEKMPGMLCAIDILAHTSQWEGLPRAVVQALLMQKPVVSFDIDGAPEVVVPGTSGELVALNDIAGFADAIRRLGQDPGLRTRYGQQGRQRCVVEFDHRTMVAALHKLYTQS